MHKKIPLRVWYLTAFLAVLVAEVLIGLYVRDAFIRPYGGDILVTVLLCCLGRVFFPDRIKLLPLWVFLFAAAVEIGQYFDLVTLLGVHHIPFLRIALGTTFSVPDLVCYGVGCMLFFLCEKHLRRQS